VAITQVSDETLMLEFQAGSRAAFEQLFARYRGPLYGYFRRRLWANGEDRAADLTQEIFLAVIRSSARYEPRALVRSYLYGIAINLLAAERRHRFRDQPPGQPAPEPTTDAAPDAALWVRQALDKLDESEREINHAPRIRATKLFRDCGPVESAREHRPLTPVSSPFGDEGTSGTESQTAQRGSCGRRARETETDCD
jgi:RNA polymerase sigma factor (sigma-70 family)